MCTHHYWELEIREFPYFHVKFTCTVRALKSWCLYRKQLLPAFFSKRLQKLKLLKLCPHSNPFAVALSLSNLSFRMKLVCHGCESIALPLKVCTFWILWRIIDPSNFPTRVVRSCFWNSLFLFPFLYFRFCARSICWKRRVF